MSKYFVYIIKGINCNNRTKYYIGYTNNLYRRIRQHNRELAGGAKATAGYKWSYVGIVANINNNIEGLQIEWRLKYSTKKFNIVSRINSFLNYIDTHLKPSPKAKILNYKLIFYLNYNLSDNLSDNLSTNVIIIRTLLSEPIIEHLMTTLMYEH
jgi:predicted GIY-YIG superfamily endonuclease